MLEPEPLPSFLLPWPVWVLSGGLFKVGLFCEPPPWKKIILGLRPPEHKFLLTESHLEPFLGPHRGGPTKAPPKQPNSEQYWSQAQPAETLAMPVEYFEYQLNTSWILSWKPQLKTSLVRGLGFADANQKNKGLPSGNLFFSRPHPWILIP